jgi:hypothetical protein
MKRPDHRHEFTVSAAVIAVFAALWVIAVATSDPPASQYVYVTSAVMFAVVAAPWVIAVLLLWRAWWARNGASLSTMDGPARLLAAAVAALPADRGDWGAAMSAELAQVRGRSGRWWFAAGCTRAATFPPRGSRVPVLAAGLAAVVAVATAALAVGHALPAMRAFAVTFVALVGTMGTLAVARSHRTRRPAPSPTIAAAGVAGVGACIAVTAYFLVEHPAAGKYLSPTVAVILAVVLAGGLWLALTPPRVLTTSRLARGLGVGAALALGLWFFLISRHTDGGPLVWILLAPEGVFFLASAAAAAAGRSFRTGVQAAVWTALIGPLLVFAIWIPESLYRYGVDAQLLLDGDLAPIGVNLADAIWALIAIPALGLPFGVIGAAVGAKRRRLHTNQSQPTTALK